MVKVTRADVLFVRPRGEGAWATSGHLLQVNATLFVSRGSLQLSLPVGETRLLHLGAPQPGQADREINKRFHGVMKFDGEI